MGKQRICAAIDVGSNSVHLLVAALTERGLRPLRDESVLLGLGDVVDRHGEVTEPAAVSLVAALADYNALARGMGARQVTLLGTDPLRRATNGLQLATQLEEMLGIQLHVLSEEQEGQLTYLGVTAGQALADSLLVVDIGGGSSEVVLAAPGGKPMVFSLPSGSARLSREVVADDPPTTAQIDGLLATARRLSALLPASRPERAVFVGGTATNLAKVAPLSRDGLVVAYRWLTRLSAQDLSARFKVNLRRARQLAAGAAILDALLTHFALEAAEVSDASLRDGAIIAASRLGPDWPQRLDAYLEAGESG